MGPQNQHFDGAPTFRSSYFSKRLNSHIKSAPPSLPYPPVYYARPQGDPRRHNSPEAQQSPHKLDPLGSSVSTQASVYADAGMRPATAGEIGASASGERRAWSGRGRKSPGSSQELQRPITAGEASLGDFGDPTGSSYKFYMKGVPGGEAREYKHFDYVYNASCTWDKGVRELDQSWSNENIMFNRMFYTWTLRRKAPSPMAKVQETTWNSLKSDPKVALEDLMEWVASIRPRCVHDYKPLLVLVQSALRIVLDKELDFFSAELLQLRRDLREAYEEIQRLGGQLAQLKTDLNLANVTEMAGRFGRKLSKLVGRRGGASDADLLLEQERRSAMQRRMDAMEAALQDKDDELDALRKENAALRGKLHTTEDKLQDTEEELEALKKRMQAMRNAERERLKEEEEERLRREMDNPMLALRMLFERDGGAWPLVSDMDEFRLVSTLAASHIEREYGGKCEMTRVTYNPAMDIDGEDDLESYDDNVLQVVVSGMGNKVGHQFAPEDNPHLFEAANGRKLVTAAVEELEDSEERLEEDAAKEPALLDEVLDEADVGEEEEDEEEPPPPEPKKQQLTAFAAPIIRTEATKLVPWAEVWGVLEARAIPGQEAKQGDQAFKLRSALKLYADGMSLAIRRMRELELAAMKKISAGQAKERWEMLRRHHITGKKSGGIWSLTEAMQIRAAKMKQYREVQRHMFQLEQQRKEVDRMLNKETGKNALAQIKVYRKPTWNIVAVMIALYTTLGHDAIWDLCPTKPDVEGEANDGARIVPKDKYDGIWKVMHKRIDTNMLLKQMKAFDPEYNLPDGEFTVYVEDGEGKKINITEQRNATVEIIVDEVTEEMAQRASLAIGLCHQWTHTMAALTHCAAQMIALEKDLGFIHEDD